ncbi:hypothetical protein ACJJTC_017540 [Scirpophaga incertulas]
MLTIQCRPSNESFDTDSNNRSPNQEDEMMAVRPMEASQQNSGEVRAHSSNTMPTSNESVDTEPNTIPKPLYTWKLEDLEDWMTTMRPMETLHQNSAEVRAHSSNTVPTSKEFIDTKPNTLRTPSTSRALEHQKGEMMTKKRKKTSRQNSNTMPTSKESVATKPNTVAKPSTSRAREYQKSGMMANRRKETSRQNSGTTQPRAAMMNNALATQSVKGTTCGDRMPMKKSRMRRIRSTERPYSVPRPQYNVMRNMAINVKLGKFTTLDDMATNRPMGKPVMSSSVDWQSTGARPKNTKSYDVDIDMSNLRYISGSGDEVIRMKALKPVQIEDDSDAQAAGLRLRVTRGYKKQFSEYTNILSFDETPSDPPIELPEAQNLSFNWRRESETERRRCRMCTDRIIGYELCPYCAPRPKPHESLPPPNKPVRNVWSVTDVTRANESFTPPYNRVRNVWSVTDVTRANESFTPPYNRVRNVWSVTDVTRANESFTPPYNRVRNVWSVTDVTRANESFTPPYNRVRNVWSVTDVTRANESFTPPYNRVRNVWSVTDVTNFSRLVVPVFLIG